MKEYRKDINEKFKCEEYGRFFKSHVVTMYNIKNCGVNETRYLKNFQKYVSCCCKKCEDEYRLAKTKETMFKKYGVINPGQVFEILERAQLTSPS